MEAKRQRRRSIRWVGHDYGGGGTYFVTICTHGHLCLFGRVVGEAMQLNAMGRVVQTCWRAIPGHFPQVELDAFVVMPNHVHGILVIIPGDGQGGNVRANEGANDDSPLPDRDRDRDRGRRPRGTSNTLGSIVRGFKIGATKWVRDNRDGRDLRQRNYYEHVIRSERQLNRIRRYIETNPATWMQDRENPDGIWRPR